MIYSKDTDNSGLCENICYGYIFLGFPDEDQPVNRFNKCSPMLIDVIKRGNDHKYKAMVFEGGKGESVDISISV